MYLKIIGSIFVLLSTSLFGYLLGLEKKLRLIQLAELKKAVSLLRGDIQYGFTPLPEALENLSSRFCTVFTPFFQDVSRQLTAYEGICLYEVWKDSVKSQLKETSLNKQDKEKLAALGETLGYLDQTMQLRNLDLYLENLSEEMKTETIQQKEKIRLCQLLGVLSGIFITILMI